MPRYDGSLLGAIARRLADRLDRLPSSADPPVDGGVEFASFIDGELLFEVARRERAETRGAGLITSSSALITLAFAGAAIVSAQDGFHPPRATIWALIPATLSFLIAAYFGLRAGRVMNLHRVSTEKLREWDEKTPTMWEAMGTDARWALTAAKLGTLESFRDGTNRKMIAAARAGRAQVVGLVFLTAAVTAVLVHAAWPRYHWCLDMLQPLGS